MPSCGRTRLASESFSTPQALESIFESILDVRCNTQLKYLAGYVSGDLKGGWAVVEREYVDRHFLDEYVGFYARELDPPSAKTTRIHFFAAHACCPLQRVRGALNTPNVGVPTEELRDQYLGFTVLRPIAAVPVGRTILRPPREGVDEHRNYSPAMGKHDVNVAGLALQVQGLPFQQQDSGIGECATTAMWSAISAAVRQHGGRTATPLTIREAARQHTSPGRLGMTYEQIARTIETIGYRAHVFRASSSAEPYAFLFELLTWLRSGVAPILHVTSEGEGHAVTLCGYRLGDENVGTFDHIEMVDGLPIVIPTRVYLHDDNVGPYMRREWHNADNGENPRLKRKHGRRDLWANELVADTLEIRNAIVPVYPKIRIPAFGLLERAIQWIGALPDSTNGAGGPTHVETLYCKGGEWMRDTVLNARPTPRAYDQLLGLCFSRYIGVVRVLRGFTPIFDVLCDATTTHQNDSYIAVVKYTVDPQVFEPEKQQALGGLAQRLCKTVVSLAE